jgi:Tfp pilus assembly pilus retraction ATPase PilT
MVDIKAILETAIENRASDVHINVGMPPVLRRDTELIDMECPPVTNQDARWCSMVGPDDEEVRGTRDLDFSTPCRAPVRVNAHWQATRWRSRHSEPGLRSMISAPIARSRRICSRAAP